MDVERVPSTMSTNAFRVFARIYFLCTLEEETPPFLVTTTTTSIAVM